MATRQKALPNLLENVVKDATLTRKVRELVELRSTLGETRVKAGEVKAVILERLKALKTDHYRAGSLLVQLKPGKDVVSIKDLVDGEDVENIADDEGEE